MATAMNPLTTLLGMAPPDQEQAPPPEQDPLSPQVTPQPQAANPIAQLLQGAQSAQINPALAQVLQTPANTDSISAQEKLKEDDPTAWGYFQKYGGKAVLDEADKLVGKPKKEDLEALALQKSIDANNQRAQQLAASLVDKQKQVPELQAQYQQKLQDLTRDYMKTRYPGKLGIANFAIQQLLSSAAGRGPIQDAVKESARKDLDSSMKQALEQVQMEKGLTLQELQALHAQQANAQLTQKIQAQQSKDRLAERKQDLDYFKAKQSTLQKLATGQLSANTAEGHDAAMEARARLQKLGSPAEVLADFISENIDAGMNPQEARTQALIRYSYATHAAQLAKPFQVGTQTTAVQTQDAQGNPVTTRNSVRQFAPGIQASAAQGLAAQVNPLGQSLVQTPAQASRTQAPITPGPKPGLPPIETDQSPIAKLARRAMDVGLNAFNKNDQNRIAIYLNDRGIKPPDPISVEGQKGVAGIDSVLDQVKRIKDRLDKDGLRNDDSDRFSGEYRKYKMLGKSGPNSDLFSDLSFESLRSAGEALKGINSRAYGIISRALEHTPNLDRGVNINSLGIHVPIKADSPKLIYDKLNKIQEILTESRQELLKDTRKSGVIPSKVTPTDEDAVQRLIKKHGGR